MNAEESHLEQEMKLFQGSWTLSFNTNTQNILINGLSDSFVVTDLIFVVGLAFSPLFLVRSIEISSDKSFFSLVKHIGF